jgi:hypothetical protein
MNFLTHVALLVAGLAGFAIWPNIRRRPADMSDSAHGIPCNFKQQRASRSNRVTVTVTVPCDERFEFTLRREGAFDRFAKALHLVREFQTRDDRFDEAVYIGADERGIDDWLAQDADARKELLDLLALEPEEDTRVRSIAAGRGVLMLSAVTKPRMLSSAPADIAQLVANTTVPALKSCVDRLRAFAAGAADPDAFRDPYAAAIRTLASLALGLVVVPLILLFIIQIQAPTLRLEDFQLFGRDTLTVSAAVLCTLLLVGLLLLRGSTRLHTALAPLLLCAAVGCVFAVPAFLSELNMEWDRSTPQHYTAQVLRLYETHGRQGTHYHVWLSNWHQQADDQDLQIDAATYQGLNDGDTVDISEHAGYLGWPWVSDLTRESSPASGGQ